MDGITIRKVTRENWPDVLKIDVAPEQRKYASPVTVAVAEAYIRPHASEIVTPYAIYAGGEMVGFFAYSADPDSADNYWINDFQIDRRHQGKGLGKAAFAAILEHLKETYPQCKRAGLTVVPDNSVARRMYESFGFRDSGEVDDGELVFYLPLT